jgi:4-alpha-methyl-delta7-sterol-4alpha-methyl oxidase
VGDLLAIYADPLFLLIPVLSSLISVAAFALFAFPMTWLAVREPAWLRPRRLQERRADPAKIIGPSVRRWLANNALLTVLLLATWPLLRLSGIHTGPLPGAPVIVGQLLLFIVLDDFLYYWMHRLMHRPWLYRRVHIVHHRHRTPLAISGHYMHPVEFLSTAGLMMLGPVLLGSHVITLYLWVIIRQWEAAEGHCGYRLPLTAALPFSDGAAHHDAHHAFFRGNYAGFLPHLDRLLGTLTPGYDETKPTAVVES